MTDTVTKETTSTSNPSVSSGLNVAEANAANATTTAGGGKAEKSQTVGYIIYFLFGLVEILLVFRLVFKLSGANPVSSFVSSIYSLTEIFIAPFAGIFRQATTPGVETTAVLEPATLVAIVVYAVFAWSLTQVAKILSGRVQ
jgi:hypothetical protein